MPTFISWNTYLAPTMFNRIQRIGRIKRNIIKHMTNSDIICLQEVYSWRIGPISKLLYYLEIVNNYPRLLILLDIFSIVEGYFIPIFIYDDSINSIITTCNKLGYHYNHKSKMNRYGVNNGLLIVSKYEILFKRESTLNNDLIAPTGILYCKINDIFIINCYLYEFNTIQHYRQIISKCLNLLCCINRNKIRDDNFNEINKILQLLYTNIVLCGDLNIEYNTELYDIFMNTNINLKNIKLNSRTSQCPVLYADAQLDYFMTFNLDIIYNPKSCYILKMNSNETNKLLEITGSNHYAIEMKL